MRRCSIGPVSSANGLKLDAFHELLVSRAIDDLDIGLTELGGKFRHPAATRRPAEP